MPSGSACVESHASNAIVHNCICVVELHGRSTSTCTPSSECIVQEPEIQVRRTVELEYWELLHLPGTCTPFNVVLYSSTTSRGTLHGILCLFIVHTVACVTYGIRSTCTGTLLFEVIVLQFKGPQ